MANELITLDLEKKVVALDDTLKTARREIDAAEKQNNPMRKALALAIGTQAIRDQLGGLMDQVMLLAGKDYGFRTDRDGKPNPYTKDQVQDVVATALLRGMQLVGNEFNIIASRFYPTQQGFARLVREWPGLTELRMAAGVPQMMSGGALVKYRASWVLNGRADSIVCDGDERICVRVNEGMGADAILGKAKAKMLRRIYERLTGSDWGLAEEAAEGDEIEAVPQERLADAIQVFEAAETERDEARTSNADPEGNAKIFAEFCDAIKACTQSGEAKRLYDALFGPDSIREFSPDQNDRAALLTNEREQQLLPKRGPRANPQRVLPGAEAQKVPQ